MENIKFKFDGKTYVVPHHAHGSAKFIVLPDRRVVEIVSWWADGKTIKEIVVREVQTGEAIYWAKEDGKRD